MTDSYIRAAGVLRREIPNLSQDAACRVLDALLDAVADSQEARRTADKAPGTKTRG